MIGASKYKDGDKVIVKTQSEDAMFAIGTVGVVEEVGFAYKVHANGDFWYYLDEHLEPAP